MQRIPTRNVSPRQATNQRQGNGEVSPVLMLARRIREEQGVEQVSAFLRAMIPFAAPNELKRIAESFGIPYDRISQKPQQHRNDGGEEQRYQQKPNNTGFNNNIPFHQQNNMNATNPMNSMNQNPQQMQMLNTLMQMQGLMGGGKADPMQLLRMMGKK